MPTSVERPTVDRLVFLHGFTQTHHHWHAAALGLAALVGSPTLTFVDLPGHGLGSDDRSTITDTARRLPAAAGRGTYVGYSMGARVALLAAADGDPALERLVLIGGTAGIDDHDDRRARAEADDRLADRLVADGVGAFLDSWLGAPMFVGLAPDPEGLEHRRRNTAAGLAHSLRTGGTGAQPSVWDRLDRITAPVLVIAGERDDKFTEIGARMVDRLQQGTFAAVPDAGHAAHTEQPAAVVATIVAWLRAVDAQPRARPIANSSP